MSIKLNRTNYRRATDFEPETVKSGLVDSDDFKKRANAVLERKGSATWGPFRARLERLRAKKRAAMAVAAGVAFAASASGAGLKVLGYETKTNYVRFEKTTGTIPLAKNTNFIVGRKFDSTNLPDAIVHSITFGTDDGPVLILHAQEPLDAKDTNGWTRAEMKWHFPSAWAERPKPAPYQWFTILGGPVFTNSPRAFTITESLVTNEVRIGTADIGSQRFNLVALRQDTNRVARYNRPDGSAVEYWTNTYQGPFIATNFVPAVTAFVTNVSATWWNYSTLRDAFIPNK